MTLKEAVQDRAIWLDTVRPGWERFIDLGKLQMSDCTMCMLGQVFADDARTSDWDDGYDYASYELEDWSRVYGSVKGERIWPFGIEQTLLHPLWSAEIRTRLENPVVAIPDVTAVVTHEHAPTV